QEEGYRDVHDRQRQAGQEGDQEQSQVPAGVGHQPPQLGPSAAFGPSGSFLACLRARLYQAAHAGSSNFLRAPCRIIWPFGQGSPVAASTSAIPRGLLATRPPAAMTL